MTTKVTIINHGPDDIAVVAEATSSPETLDSPIITTVLTNNVVGPGHFREYYVHANQRLRVIEIGDIPA